MKREAMRDCKILLAGNDETILDVAGKSLEHLGYQVTPVISGAKAIETLRNGEFDLVITQLAMGKPDGIDVLQNAKHIKPDIGVILFTGDPDVGKAVNAFRLGADDYLLKPYSLAEMAARVANCLKEAERRRRKRMDMLLLSHDIRSPLVSMLADLKMVRQGHYGALKKNLAVAMDKLFAKCTKLNGVAEEYLSKASLFGGGLQEELQPLNLVEDIIAPVLDELSVDIKENEVVIDNRIVGAESAGRISVGTSKLWLKAIYRNLFRNAIKYGCKGCTLGFDVQKNGCHYRLNVFNTGSVIPEKEREKLFVKFGRLAENNHTDGSGLGLYLAKEIIKKHGGDIWYENDDHNSTFVFTLPRGE